MAVRKVGIGIVGCGSISVIYVKNACEMFDVLQVAACADLLPERAEAISKADAPVAARVRAAGGVIMGKTNVPPYAADYQSANPLFGHSNNPWNLTHTPGVAVPVAEPRPSQLA